MVHRLALFAAVAAAALRQTSAAPDPAGAFVAGLASGLGDSGGGGGGGGSAPWEDAGDTTTTPPLVNSWVGLRPLGPHLPSPRDAARAAGVIGAGVGVVRRAAGAASGVAALSSLAGMAAPAVKPVAAAAAAAAASARPAALPTAAVGLSAAARAVEAATRADAVETRDPIRTTAGDGVANGHVPLNRRAGGGGGGGGGEGGNATSPRSAAATLPLGTGVLASAIDGLGGALDTVASAARVAKTTADDRQVEAGWDLKAGPEAVLTAFKTSSAPAREAAAGEFEAIKEELVLAAAAAGRVKDKADAAAAAAAGSPPAWKTDVAARVRAAASGPAATELANAVAKDARVQQTVAAAAPAVSAGAAAAGRAADAVGGLASDAGGAVRIAAVAGRAAALQAAATARADPGASLTAKPAKDAASAAAGVLDYVDDAPTCGGPSTRLVVELAGTAGETACSAWLVEGAEVGGAGGRRHLLGAAARAAAPARAPAAAPRRAAKKKAAPAPPAAPARSSSTCDAPLLPNITARGCTHFPGTLSIIYTGGPATVDPDVAGALARLGLGDLVRVGSLELAAEGGAQAGPGLGQALRELRSVGGVVIGDKGGGGGYAPASSAGGELFDPAGLYIHSAPGNTFATLPAWPMLAAVGGPLLIQGSLQAGLPSLVGVSAVGGGLALVSNPALKSTLPGLAMVKAVGAGGGEAGSSPASAASADTVTGGALVVERNPALATVALPLLTAVGGQVVVRDNPALKALALPLLGSVNAAGSDRYGREAVIITGNTALADLGGLLRAASCLDPPATPILVEVFPRGGGGGDKAEGEGGDATDQPPRPWKCTFTRWSQVCQYALVERGKGVDAGSHWVQDGVCVVAG